VGAIFALLAVLAAFPAIAGAATITVTTASDVPNGQCTLRDAILAANTNAAKNACPAGESAPVTDVIQFSLAGPSTITLGSALPGVLDLTSIVGPGEGQLTISGANAFRVLDFSGTATASVSGVTITEGAATEGAGIVNDGTLALDQVAVVGNVAKVEGGPNTFPEGGGIRNGGDLTLIRSTVSGNSAIGKGGTVQNAPEGGGIYNNSGSLTIEESTVSGNIARAVAGPGGSTNAVGGAIDNSGKLSLKRSTVSGNSASASGSTSSNQAQGGGIANGNSVSTVVTIEGSTVSGNSASATGKGSLTSVGGGLTSYGSSIAIASSTIIGNSAVSGANLGVFKVPTVSNTIVADPLGSTESCSSHLQSAGFNLEDGSTCGFTKPTDRQKTDPLLSPAGLADNGGPTATIALQLGSPAINQGLSAPGETVDQRGLTRPVLLPGFPVVRPGSNGTDIGAYELQIPVPPSSPSAGAPTVTPAAPSGPPRVRVSCPKSAKPGGCRFALQVFSAKPHKHLGKGKRGRAKKPVAESAVARVKVAPGKSALVTLTPKPKYATKLEAAAKLLVREVETLKGTTHTSFRRLKVVG
jgi:CSLREA domain-containing protein